MTAKRGTEAAVEEPSPRAAEGALTEIDGRSVIFAEVWCARCKGRGYTYCGHDPDWCEWCGGGNRWDAIYDAETMELIYG